MREKLSILSLVLVNLFPIFGVLFLEWDLSSILFLYWFENIVIGFYNVLKMITSRKPNEKGVIITSPRGTRVDRTKSGMVVFFILHYGLFTFGHGVFLYTLLSKHLTINLTLITSIAFLFVSHGISYFTNYINKREYERLSPEDLMGAPYLRVLIMHITVLFGSALLISINGQSAGPLIVLTIIKITVDIFSHNFEHNKTIPVSSKKISNRVIHLDPKLVKMVFPNFEKFAEEAYKKSVETGKWDEIKLEMDPETVKQIEDYWLKNHGVSSKKETRTNDTLYS